MVEAKPWQPSPQWQKAGGAQSRAVYGKTSVLGLPLPETLPVSKPQCPCPWSEQAGLGVSKVRFQHRHFSNSISVWTPWQFLEASSEGHCPLVPVTSRPEGFVYRHCHLPGLFLKLLICAPKQYNLGIWVPLLLVWNVAVLIVKNERHSKRQQRAPVGFPKNGYLWEKEREYLEHILHETHCCLHCICVIPQKSIFKEITSLEDGNQEVSSAESSSKSIIR